MFGVARVLTCFGPRKTLEESTGFTTSLALSYSKNTKFRCHPIRLAFCSISFTLKQVLLLLGCSIASNKLKVAFWSSTLISKLSFPISITHFVVNMNGRPRIKGISSFSSMSMITKSTRKVSWWTLTRTSSTTPNGLVMELSAS